MKKIGAILCISAFLLMPLNAKAYTTRSYKNYETQNVIVNTNVYEEIVPTNYSNRYIKRTVTEEEVETTPIIKETQVIEKSSTGATIGCLIGGLLVGGLIVAAATNSNHHHRDYSPSHSRRHY